MEVHKILKNNQKIYFIINFNLFSKNKNFYLNYRDLEIKISSRHNNNNNSNNNYNYFRTRYQINRIHKFS
jgi:hypothetical protein